MGATKPQRPPTRGQLLTGTQLGTDPAVTSRLLANLGDAHSELASTTSPRVVVTATLIAGPNVIAHGLGRKPAGAHVTPTTASTAFAWALTASDTKQATITCVGPTQTNASVEFH